MTILRNTYLLGSLILAASSLSTQASAESLFGNEGRALRIGSSIVSKALHFLGSGNVTGSKGPWCADFVSLVLHDTGHRPLPNHTARSALNYGPRTARPKQGDLMVLKHSHVGIFMGYGPRGQVKMVSGNWGHRVRVASLSRHAVLAFIHT